MYSRCDVSGLAITVGDIAQMRRIDKEDRTVMMTRFSPLDALFYRLENTAYWMYVGSLWILRSPRAGLCY